MDINGKVVAILGDSITEGVGVSSKDKRFADVFARITNSKVYNYGISGTRIARQTNPDPNPSFDLNFLERVDGMVEDADLIVVFGGTNDFGHGDARFGVFEDRDEYSFYGAMHSLLRRLISKYPKGRIVFMTPLHRLSEMLDINERGLKRHLLKDYVNAIREVCEYYSVPVLDLYSNSGMQPSVEIIKEMYMPDGLHPSDLGAERIANMLSSFVMNL